MKTDIHMIFHETWSSIHNSDVESRPVTETAEINRKSMCDPQSMLIIIYSISWDFVFD